MPNIDLKQIVENEWKIKVLEKSLDKLIQKNNINLQGLSQKEINDIREEVVNDLNKKYPGAGLNFQTN